MANTSSSSTLTMTEEELNEYYDSRVKEEAKKALDDSTGVWKGIEWFMNWLRNQFKEFMKNKLIKIPIIGRYASRIGTAVSELVFTVFVSTTHFLKVVFCSPKMWQKAHEAAMSAWNINEQNGVLAQTYAYRKKMAAFFLELIKQCLERAIVAHGLELTDDEKFVIFTMLDELLPSSSSAAKILDNK